MKKQFNKFFLLWIGQFIASIGHGLSAFSLGVYAFSTSHSALDSSMVMLLGFLPSVLLLLPAGVLADKYDRRSMMILGDGLSALGILFILAMKMQGNLQLIHVYVGIVISSVFSSLMQPAYQATVTDLLSEEEYSRASGMVQIASSARYLVSPVLAGFLLERFNIELILSIDICTIFITVLTSFVVKKNLPKKESVAEKDFFNNLLSAWKILRKNTGVYKLTLIASFLTFFIGIIQTLASPYLLSFSNAETLGIILSLSSVGMLVSGIIIGIFPIKRNFVRLLSLSLFFAGIFMMSFGFSEIITIITASGFLFFATLPIANASLDYLVRTNIENTYQGRIWAFIGFISQMGYVIAYPLAGILADEIFTPALSDKGFLSNSVGLLIGTGDSRGIGFLIILAGISLSFLAISVNKDREIRNLENYLKTGGSNES